MSYYHLIEAERISFCVPMICRMLGVKKRLLRLEGQAAFKEEPREKT